MSTCLLETAYFPNIQFFSYLATHDHCLLEACEHYQKGSYRNRCHLAGSHGLLRLTVPLKKGKNEQMPITKTNVSYDQNWPLQHWATIQSTYGKAPFFSDYAVFLRPLLENPPGGLFALNQKIIHTLCDLLMLPPPGETSDFQLNYGDEINDYRGVVHPKSHRATNDPNFHAPHYPQIFADRIGFQPNLSILDLLFCVGPEAVLYLQQAFRPA